MSESQELRKSIFVADAEETERLGERLGRALTQGLLILLMGDLGAGKTTFAHGLGRGLEVPTPIQSPTFALIYEHRERIPLAHMDFYRLNASAELSQLGLDEYLDSNFAVLIEWPEIVMEELPEDRIEIRIASETSGRRFEIAAKGEAVSIGMEWTETA